MVDVCFSIASQAVSTDLALQDHPAQTLTKGETEAHRGTGPC
jgi:hypothetical protein